MPQWSAVRNIVIDNGEIYSLVVIKTIWLLSTAINQSECSTAESHVINVDKTSQLWTKALLFCSVPSAPPQNMTVEVLNSKVRLYDGVVKCTVALMKTLICCCDFNCNEQHICALSQSFTSSFILPLCSPPPLSQDTIYICLAAGEYESSSCCFYSWVCLLF